MLAIMAGADTARDPLIVAQAIATALVWRTQQACHSIDDSVGINNRLNQFRSLFDLLQLCKDATFLSLYEEACGRVARHTQERNGIASAEAWMITLARSMGGNFSFTFARTDDDSWSVDYVDRESRVFSFQGEGKTFVEAFHDANQVADNLKEDET